MSGRRLLGFIILIAVISTAQIAAQRRGFGGYYSIRRPTPTTFNGDFTFCRVAFRQAYDGDGGGWGVDYPRSDMNLPIRLSELSRAPVNLGQDGEVNHVVVTLTEPELFNCPFVMMTEVGAAYFDDDEAKALRNYLLKGGFLWADDFWGERAWAHWEREIRKVLPSGQYPIVDVPMNHSMLHTLFDVAKIPQIPAIGNWGGPGGRTSERGADSAVPHARIIADDRGRVVVFMTHNTDFGDAYEREADDPRYFYTFSVDGYAIGINVLLYAMTH
jgi:hypothetical protein